jgi:hypothetical protein
MNDEPKRVLVGTFPSGLGAVASFSDMGPRLISEAQRELDAAKAEREERERIERETIRVSRQWFLQTMRVLVAYVERDEEFAACRGNFRRSDTLARKARRLRGDIDATLAYNDGSRQRDGRQRADQSLFGQLRSFDDRLADPGRGPSPRQR